MERSIDHLVATHKLAQERRKAGKQVWDRTIKIKDIIDEDEANETNAHAVKVAKAIAERLEAGVPPAWRDIQSPQDYDDDLWDRHRYAAHSGNINLDISVSLEADRYIKAKEAPTKITLIPRSTHIPTAKRRKDMIQDLNPIRKNSYD